MAIIRPPKSGPKKKQIEKKKLTGKPVAATNKQQGSKKPSTKKTVSKKKTAPAKQKSFSPPDILKTVEDWTKWLGSESISNVSKWLEGLSQADISVELGLSLQTLSKALLRPTVDMPDDYNAWLDYFSDMTRAETEHFILTHTDTLDNEAMAAGNRWLHIAENPELIDKIVKGRLETRKAEEAGDIMAAAKSGDDLKLYEALRNDIAWKIKDAGGRDTTSLIKQLNEVTLHLNTIYRERGMTDEQQNSNIRKMLINARNRSRRPKQQAVQTISDFEDHEGENV